jgi:hypothetical protein
MEGSNTKLLQVVSFQKHFHNLNDDQISDLIKFNSSKFVRVSSLENLGSIMIYMFQGIHRLQICSNWTYRTKVMNFMVFVSHFASLFFNQHFSQNQWGFSVEMGSTHFKDFIDIKFVIFGQVFYFISILLDLHQI